MNKYSLMNNVIVDNLYFWNHLFDLEKTNVKKCMFFMIFFQVSINNLLIIELYKCLTRRITAIPEKTAQHIDPINTKLLIIIVIYFQNL